jgi:integrase
MLLISLQEAREMAAKRSRRGDHLQLRGETYFYRRLVPDAVQNALGKTAWVQTLRTSDLKVARVRAKRLDVEVEGLFQAAREGVVGVGSKVALDHAHQLIEQTCVLFTRDALKHDRRERIRLRDTEAGDSGLQRGDVAAMLREQHEDGRLPVAEAVATLKKHGVTLTPEALTDLFYAMRPAELRARKLVEADRDADYRGDSRVTLPGDRAAQANLDGPPLTVAPSPTLGEAVESYKRDRIATGTWREQTAIATGAQLDRLVTVIGGEVEVNAVTRDALREWRDSLSLEMKPSSVGQYVQMTHSLFEWLISEEVVSKNPAKKLAPKAPSKKDADARKAYTRGDVRLLFDERHTAYREDWPMFFWVPLLALYSGARVSELCQLSVDDVHKRKGVHCFEIRSAIPGQRLKNPNSERTVPLHSHLVTLGFLDFVKERRRSENGQPWVFEGRQPPSSPKGAGTRMSKHWAEQRTKRIAGLTPGAVFHSFRMLLTQELMERGEPRYLIDQITGHADTSMSTGVYGAPVTLEKRAEIIGLLDFSAEVNALHQA